MSKTRQHGWWLAALGYGAALCFVRLAQPLSFEWAILLMPLTWLLPPLLRGLPLPAAAGKMVVALLIPLLLAAVQQLLVPVCAPLQGLVFFVLLPFTGLGLSLAAWFLLERCPCTFRWKLLLYIMLIGLNLAWLIFEYYHTPLVRFHSWFLGYIPGPLYDEVLNIPQSLVFFRLANLLVCLPVLFALHRAGKPGGPFDATFNLLCALPVLLGLALLAAGGEFGFNFSSAALNRELAVVSETAHFQTHADPGVDPAQLQITLREIEGWWHALANKFGGAPERPEKIQLYFYLSAAQKQRLMGAGETEVSKPWRNEIHMQWEPFPSATLGHEIAHVLVGQLWGKGVWRVPTHGGLPDFTLIEGVAQAAAAPATLFSPASKARALLEQDRLPKAQDLLGVTGFFNQSPGHSYESAGALVDFLWQTRGSNFLKTIYSGAPPPVFWPAIDEEWRNWLLRQPLSPNLRAWAEDLGAQKPLLRRTCGRVQAELADQLETALHQHQPARMEECARRILAYDPGQIRARRGLVEARILSAKFPQAELQALTLPENPRSLKIWALETQGDQAALQNSPTEARMFYAGAMALAPAAPQQRQLDLKLYALQHSAGLLPGIISYLRNPVAAAALPALVLLAEHNPQAFAPNYLLGRLCFLRNDPQNAGVYLERLAEFESAAPVSLQLETIRLRALVQLLQGNANKAKELLALLQTPDTPVEFRNFAGWMREMIAGGWKN